MKRTLHQGGEITETTMGQEVELIHYFIIRCLSARCRMEDTQQLSRCWRRHKHTHQCVWWEARQWPVKRGGKTWKLIGRAPFHPSRPVTLSVAVRHSCWPCGAAVSDQEGSENVQLRDRQKEWHFFFFFFCINETASD